MRAAHYRCRHTPKLALPRNPPAWWVLEDGQAPELLPREHVLALPWLGEFERGEPKHLAVHADPTVPPTIGKPLGATRRLYQIREVPILRRREARAPAGGPTRVLSFQLHGSSD